MYDLPRYLALVTPNSFSPFCFSLWIEFVPVAAGHRNTRALQSNGRLQGSGNELTSSVRIAIGHVEQHVAPTRLRIHPSGFDLERSGAYEHYHSTVTILASGPLSADDQPLRSFQRQNSCNHQTKPRPCYSLMCHSTPHRQGCFDPWVDYCATGLSVTHIYVLWVLTFSKYIVSNVADADRPIFPR